MANQTPVVIKQLRSDKVKNMFNDIFQDENKSNKFVISLINVVNDTYKLQTVELDSVLFAAAKAARMDLPIDPTLGFAYIIPYGSKAQFQIGYKGLIQLAHRTGKYLHLHSTDVKEGEIQHINRLTGTIDFEWIQDQDERNTKKTVGYLAFFKMTNGFENFLYMTNKELTAHASSYSQAYRYDKSQNKSDSNWNTNFDSMAKKTVLKLLLSKYGELSLDMQDAIKSDQGVIKNLGGDLVDYVDNKVKQSIEEASEAKERNRLRKWIKNAKTPEDFKQLNQAIYELDEKDELRVAYEDKLKSLEK